MLKDRKFGKFRNFTLEVNMKKIGAILLMISVGVLAFADMNINNPSINIQVKSQSGSSIGGAQLLIKDNWSSDNSRQIISQSNQYGEVRINESSLQDFYLFMGNNSLRWNGTNQRVPGNNQQTSRIKFKISLSVNAPGFQSLYNEYEFQDGVKNITVYMDPVAVSRSGQNQSQQSVRTSGGQAQQSASGVGESKATALSIRNASIQFTFRNNLRNKADLIISQFNDRGVNNISTQSTSSNIPTSISCRNRMFGDFIRQSIPSLRNIGIIIVPNLRSDIQISLGQ